MNEDQFREQLIKDLEKRGIMCINMYKGTFDIYIPIFKRFIECKQIENFEYKPNMKDKSGIQFGEYQTKVLRKLSKLQDYKELPIIAIMDNITNKGSFYLITSKETKQHTIKKMKYREHMAISISYFNNKPLSYDNLLDELIKEIKGD